MEPKRVNGPSDPATTTVDCVFTKKITIVLPVPDTVGGNVTDDLITGELPPVGLTYRIQKVSFYAPAAANAFIEVNDLKSDEAGFVDYGTQGSVRPQIHIRPAWQLRNAWFDRGTSETFYSVFGNGGASSTVIVQMTVEVRIHVPLPTLRNRARLLAANLAGNKALVNPGVGSVGDVPPLDTEVDWPLQQ